MKVQTLLVLMCTVFLLGACNSDDTQAEAEKEFEGDNSVSHKQEAEENTNEEDFLRFATDSVEELMRQEPGIYKGDHYNEELIFQEISSFPSDIPAEEFYYRLLALMAEDFREEQELIDSFQVQYDSVTATPEEEIKINQEEMEENRLNVQILLDASGSMSQEMEGTTKMTIAKEAVKTFVSSLPEAAHVSLHVYGHEGRDEPEVSCQQTETMYELSPYEEGAFENAINSFEATGYTPIARAIEEAGAQFPEKGEHVMYIVSDGHETCGGDPVLAIKAMQESGVSAVVNIIGFDVEEDERAALEAIANAGDGDYFSANSAASLTETFTIQSQDLKLAWLQWENSNTLNALHSQNTQTLDLLHTQNSATLRSLTETNRMILIVNGSSQNFDFDASDVTRLIQDRGTMIRNHLKDSLESFRQDVKETGTELRQDIREKGTSERNQLD
ncbi:VWA domain-containing protein [Alkalihalobacillus oceani]|uniref:vWA domain-containing protein n=1 Tax=Halalkalibacter oceani TaxID=1653776 RepID=UPI00203D80F3|nr:VWA domain-containing protein [Halalkalibacter oceani]